MKICACNVDKSGGVVGCPTCLGHGLLWDDGVPMTRCPGGGAHPIADEPTKLPCGRTNETCPGCDRRREDIPNADDVVRTLEHHRRLHEAASDG